MTFVDPARFNELEPLISRAIQEMFSPHDGWLLAGKEISDRVRRLAPDVDVALIVACVNQYLEDVRQQLRDPFTSVQPTPIAPRDEPERALIDHLIAATKLYGSGGEVEELIAFAARMRSFAPFNAMLLHIQKPGLTHAATSTDWSQRFGRTPKRGARPLLILRTMGPVDFVFDIQDTEGEALPDNAFSFPTFGSLTEARFGTMLDAVSRGRIAPYPFDAGDSHAGWIRLTERNPNPNGKNHYQLGFNRNHSTPTRFVTVAHELGHLFLGHLGKDSGRNIADRRDLDPALKEVEAETTAYLVAKRNGLQPRSESYLAHFQGAFRDLDLFAVTKAANAVETAMGVSAHKLWSQSANNR